MTQLHDNPQEGIDSNKIVIDFLFKRRLDFRNRLPKHIDESYLTTITELEDEVAIWRWQLATSNPALVTVDRDIIVSDDAHTLYSRISIELSENKNVMVDFRRCEVCGDSVLNQCIGYLIRDYTPEVMSRVTFFAYRERADLIRSSIEFQVEYFKEKHDGQA